MAPVVSRVCSGTASKSGNGDSSGRARRRGEEGKLATCSRDAASPTCPQGSSADFDANARHDLIISIACLWLEDEVSFKILKRDLRATRREAP